ncbi:MAG: GAF domain-containing protein, partial [Bdellovibrionota bacterium]
GLQLDLAKYPEIQVVMNTGKMIAIENLENSRALKKIKTEIKTINFNSMIVCPILYRGKPFGVISVRLKDGQTKIREEDIHFVGVVAKIASLALNAADISKMTKFGLISA